MNRNTKLSRKAIKVLVADDHVTVREGLTAIIGRQEDMAVVANAANGQEAVEMWSRHHPDVTLLDLRMPVMDGVTATEEIRRQDSTAKIIILTTYDTDNEILRAIRAGAKAYLLKDSQREDLLDCIRRIDRGETFITPCLVEKLAAGLASQPLTSRELDVLTSLAQGLSNKEIGARLCITETTVKSHLRAIFSKLDVLSRTEALATASQRGLIRYEPKR
jgi:two-component system NarL family response regulator